jgi:hypothetical protein
MADINLDPRIGEEVFVKGHSGRFRITKVDPCSDNYRLPRFYGWVDLELLTTGFRLTHIPVGALSYDEERPVYRAIEWLKENRVVPFPDYVLDYKVEAKNDHQGNPAFYVRFFVEPDDQPSPEKIEEINRFLSSVQTMLLSLGMDRWPYVQVSEKRSLLDVAS